LFLLFSRSISFSCLYEWPDNEVALFQEAANSPLSWCVSFFSKYPCPLNQSYRRTFQRSFIISQCLSLRMVLIHQMPCIRRDHRDHRRFLPHFPPGPMRCEFSPELVPPLPHAMMGAFPKSESEPTYGSPISPLTPTAFPQQLIPKPPGEVTRVGRGGYTLKDLLEGQSEWKSGLYDKIRVFATRS
jgi:hypothetical protein